MAFVIDGRIVALDSPHRTEDRSPAAGARWRYRGRRRKSRPPKFGMDIADDPAFHSVLKTTTSETGRNREASLGDVFVEVTGRQRRQPGWYLLRCGSASALQVRQDAAVFSDLIWLKSAAAVPVGCARSPNLCLVGDRDHRVLLRQRDPCSSKAGAHDGADRLERRNGSGSTWLPS